MRASLGLAMILCGAACASDLRDESDGGPGSVDASGAPIVETSPRGDGQFESRVNSSDFDAWIFVSFASGASEALEVTEDSLDWDVAFRRFQIKLNGGVSGPGAGALAVIEGARLEDLIAAPVDGYVTDEADDDEDDDDEAELAFETAAGGWYDYDPETHVLSPKPRAYAIRGARETTEDATIGLTIESYYNEAGSSARFTIHWKRF